MVALSGTSAASAIVFLAMMILCTKVIDRVSDPILSERYSDKFFKHPDTFIVLCAVSHGVRQLKNLRRFFEVRNH